MSNFFAFATKNSWDEDVTSLVINPETAPVVKMIFQKYLDGMNITQLARYLNEQKIMSLRWIPWLTTWLWCGSLFWRPHRNGDRF